ncbi:MAG: hypothetical protein HETSPECPRED_009854 [Heterodermia speciosa]|uniref:CUE domain-containing protein n=1 Tax=Heterodermia speciosa TaxID=116794 RepID=A0A8H3G9P5_9LECA|nr:MAG: hypothetical protein HETSPECPRED_009854 [Heterodermia speciosa]
MFPQLDRRAIQWDLHRNGGSIAATTERVLSRGSLDRPPLSFQPPQAPVTPAPPRAAPKVAPQPDLITRYNLKSKLSAAESPGEPREQGRGQETGSWSESKNERAELLRRRREEMILNARRKMESKDRQTGH